ncbi:MAG: peptidylprolyl isomerase [Clostridiales bacterium]|nr:peptidylprolyl isomerase [Clostridiales bacterium]
MNRNPILTIQTGHGTIQIELYPESAPNAVACMIQIVQKQLLDHRQIRRIAPDFVVQPSFTCYNDPRLTMELPGEFAANGFQNGAVMREGSVAMGGDGKSIASGSEFFFCLTDEAGASLQGRFSVIGQVIEGWDEVKRLEQVPKRRLPIPDRDDVIVYIPLEPEYMEKVTVETFGVAYPEPQISGWQELSDLDPEG